MIGWNEWSKVAAGIFVAGSLLVGTSLARGDEPRGSRYGWGV